jgi:hypothetical protein
MKKKYIITSKEQFKGLPLPYKFLFEIKFPALMAEKIKKLKYGVTILDFNTTLHAPAGHYKPISKIINYDLLENEDNEKYIF